MMELLLPFEGDDELANHEAFTRSLRQSRRAVWFYAKVLNAQGHHVTVNAARVAPSHAEWYRHSDGGDLSISSRIEVRHLTARFTCAQDWPFKDFIVTSVHSWDLAFPKPLYYVCLNPEMTHMAKVYGNSRPEWTTTIKNNRKYQNRTQHFYVAPLRVVQFEPILIPEDYGGPDRGDRDAIPEGGDTR